MSARSIKGIADIREIESLPYEAFMPHQSVFDGLASAARLHPDRRALTFIASSDTSVPSQSWTYSQFIDQVRRAAQLFTELAGGEPPRVAMLLPAIPQAYFTLWGAETAGVVCPINYLLGAEHIAELVRAARINILVALGPHPELDIWSCVPHLRAHCPGLKAVLAVGGAPDAPDFDALLADRPAREWLQRPGTSADDLVALFHTGGTTGHPKLARHTHKNQLHAAWGAACMYSATERDVVLNGFPLFHVAGSFVYGLSTLLSGGELVLPTLLGLRNTGFMKAYWKFLERHRVTLLAGVPTVMSTLLGVPRAGEDLSRVRCLLTGGSPLPTELADAFEQRLGIAVRNILGMTECAGVIAIEPTGAPRVPGSVGLALPFTAVQVADEAGQALPDGADGILRLRGPNVSPGYTDAKNDAGVFTGDGWLVSGDIGHRDANGYLHVTGRSKDVIIRSSHNIDPAVIEEALLRHPAVLMAAAVGAPDDYAGELPVAFVSLRPGSRIDAAALSEFAQRYIPERPAYPKTIHILEALPMTAIGKLFKPAMRTLAAQAVLQERLARHALNDDVTVEVTLEGKEQVARFTASGGSDVASRLRDMMQGFPLKYRIEARSPAGAGARP
ncbi:MAG: AMP-binding enzyme family protein [Polaromonas sp.]|nr:AMP-binding enzyme family protein [Polaromonas sp.]